MTKKRSVSQTRGIVQLPECDERIQRSLAVRRCLRLVKTLTFVPSSMRASIFKHWETNFHWPQYNYLGSGLVSGWASLCMPAVGIWMH